MENWWNDLRERSNGSARESRFQNDRMRGKFRVHCESLVWSYLPKPNLTLMKYDIDTHTQGHNSLRKIIVTGRWGCEIWPRFPGLLGEPTELAEPLSTSIYVPLFIYGGAVRGVFGNNRAGGFGDHGVSNKYPTFPVSHHIPPEMSLPSCRNRLRRSLVGVKERYL